MDGIINLYNSSLPNGPSFVRNADFLRHLMHYPGTQDAIFVAEKGSEIEGIAIVSISNKEELIEGNIIELRAKNASTIDLLIQKTLQCCCARGVDIVSVRPLMDKDTAKIFDGWIKVDFGVMMAKPLYILPILEALLNTDLVKKHYTQKSLVFNLDEEIIRLEVSANGVQIGELGRPLENSAIQVTMSSKTFLDIIFAWANPYIAYLAGRIRIRGLKNALVVLRLLYSIRIESPWYVALADQV